MIKKIITKIDNRFKTNLYEKAVKLREFYHPFIFKWKFKLGITNINSIKLHIGCGGIKKEGYINIDAIRTFATDIVYDVTRKLPFEDNSVEIIECYHALEHLPICLHANIDPKFGEPYASLIRILNKWRRVLKPNGKLIIEVPHFEKLVEEYINADNKKKEELIVYIYGSYRFHNIHDIHRWGCNEYRLEYILKKAGFRNIEFKEAEDYHKEFCPSLRVECIK